MDGETPSWLEETSSPTPTPAAAPAPSPAAAPEPSAFSLEEPAPTSSKTANAPRTGTTDNVAGSILANMTERNEAKPEVDESDLPKMILFMRILNMAAAGLLIATSIVKLVDFPHISVWVTAIYACFGGLLICCLETQLKFIRTSIAMNFGFLFHSVYRFIFYCLMASVCWSYDNLLGLITAILLGVVAVFNTFILCRYPTYRKMRETIAADEDKRIEAKINQQVRKQAISSVFGGN